MQQSQAYHCHSPRARQADASLPARADLGLFRVLLWLALPGLIAGGIATPLAAQTLLPPDAAVPQLPGASAPVKAPESLAPPPGSSPTSPTTLAKALNSRGDLTLRDSSLGDALFTVGKLWGINIVSGKLNGKVNGVFKDAPLREILDSILLSNGYGYRAVGESLVVTDLNRLGQVNPFFESATIPIQAADVNEIVAGASLLSTPQGRVQAIPSAHSVFVLDFPDRVRMIRAFAASVDAAASGNTASADGEQPITAGPRRLEVAYMKAHYIAAQTAAEVLASVLSPLGKVTAMESQDRLLVVDYAENLLTAQRVLERIDRPRPQVSIKSLIYDLSLTDIEQLGVNWSSITNGSLTDFAVSPGGAVTGTGALASGAGTLFNSQTVSPFAAGNNGGAFTFSNLSSNVSLSAVALLLQQADDSRLLASPAVTVAENEEALIQSVQEIPFQQLTQTQGGGAIGTTAFKEAGITLQVTPKIARDLTVEMVVRPEFSLLTGFTPGDNQPIIDRRTASTTVRVANGSTLVIGGMRQRSDVGSIAGIPFLKDIRVLGHLFRSRQTDIRESELVVFITPTIVGFDTPPSPRDEQAAEAIRCQLGAIPPAAGCFPGHGCNAACADDFSITDAPVRSVGRPVDQPLKNAPLPPRSSVLSDTLQTPEVATRPRRLPPVLLR